jgi:uncharacterized delta-60 repeat protein
VKKLIPAVLAGALATGLMLGLAPVSGASAGTAGSLDPTFGNGGVVLSSLGQTPDGTPVNPNASAATLLPNGDIVVGGAFGLVRYLPNGQLDPTFGTGGVTVPTGQFAQTDSFLAGLFPPGLAVQPDGKYLLAGAPDNGNGFAVVRFNTNGSVDQSFGNGGVADIAIPNSNVEGADTVLVQPNGKILVGGDLFLNLRGAPEAAAMARFNADGSVDTTFGSGGSVTESTSFPTIGKLGLDAAGDIFTLPTHAEFSPSGQLDAAVTPAPITTSSLGGDVFLPSGGYVVANTVGVAKHDDDIQVQRFNANGSVAVSSPAFDFSGATGLDQARDSAGAVAVQPNGQIVVGGSHFLAGSPIGVARVNADGSLDQAFGSGGTVLTTVQGNESASIILIQPDGKILAIGFSENNATGISDIAIVRYLGS